MAAAFAILLGSGVPWGAALVSHVCIEDFSRDPESNGWVALRATGDAANEASWTGGTELLTRAADGKGAALFVARCPLVADVWIADFDFRAGGGTGGDGLVFLFHKEVDVGAVDGDLAFGPGGFGFELDNDADAWDPPYAHYGFIQGTARSHLATAPDWLGATEDGRWHHATIWHQAGVAYAFVDGILVLQAAIPTLGRATGVGFSAATGTLNHEHEVDNFQLEQFFP